MQQDNKILVDEQLDAAMLALCDASLRHKGMQAYSTINDLFKSISNEEENYLSDSVLNEA